MTQDSKLPKITVICPIFNEEQVIPLFFGRIAPVLESISERYRSDLVFVNNASSDNSLGAVHKIRAMHPNVYAISLSRNVGYQRSVECGLRSTVGDYFLVIDVDCEDPPEMIPTLLKEIESGAQIAYGERVDRPESALIKWFRKVFYRVTRAVADEEIVLDMAEFLVMNAEVRNAIIRDSNSFPFIRASIGRIGFKRVGIPYRRESRIAGETHYNFFGMTTFAIAGILSSSTLLLRLPAYLFPVWLGAVAILASLYATSGSPMALVGTILTAAGYLGATCAAIAIYVARAYKNTLGRPNFVIDRRNTILQDSMELEPDGNVRSVSS